MRNRLEAWLLFLCSEKPEDIFAIIERYPDFRAMYEQIYRICQNVERIMGFFSDELKIMDRNMVRFMIDDMSQQIETQTRQLEEQSQQLEEQSQQLEEQSQQLSQKDLRIRELQEQIEKLKKLSEGQDGL